MKRLIVGWACVFCFVHAVYADASSTLLPSKKSPSAQTANIPWEDLNERAVVLVQQVQDKPTVFARGPVEIFPCSPDQYYWLLDNPDRVVIAWRRLGAKCVNITPRGPKRFGFADEQGSDVIWETIHNAQGVRIWYAEGKVKGSTAMPMVPVKAIVILHHSEGKSSEGNTVVQHQAELVIHTDSKAAAAVTRLMGQSATKLAEQGLGQLQLFFSALSSYVDRHPDQTDALFRPDNLQAIQQTQKTSR